MEFETQFRNSNQKGYNVIVYIVASFCILWRHFVFFVRSFCIFCEVILYFGFRYRVAVHAHFFKVIVDETENWDLEALFLPNKAIPDSFVSGLIFFANFQGPGADAINISGPLNPKKFGNFKNQML